MTIGENIQYYRKRKGMSQEALAQKLLVSRQTVSLWENDQTVPAIDNLIRLKEIFGVSVDKILGSEEDVQEDIVAPEEIYRFNYSDDELSEVYKISRRIWFKRPLLFLVINVAVLFFVVCLNDLNDLIDLIEIASTVLFISSISFVRQISANRKIWKKSKIIMLESCYEYQFYNDFVKISIYRNNETVQTSKIYFQEIEQIQDCGKYLFLIISGHFYILRKTDLSENSVFYSFMKNNPEKTVFNNHSGFLKTLSAILVAASIFSIFAALVLMSNVSNSNHLFVENTWLFFLFVPIPVLSIVFGLILKSKGYKYKKNVIVGIVMTLLLCAYGTFSFAFSHFYIHNDEPVNRIEQYLNIDIPEYEQINTIDMTEGEQSSSRVQVYYTSDVYFDDNAGNSFVSLAANDERWLPSVPNDLIGISSDFYYYLDSDFSLFYNTDNDEYNTIPAESGKYHFISVFYQSERKQMEIVEYELNYVK